MKFVLLLLCTLFAFSGCSTIKQVNLKTGVGNEVREHGDTNHRFSVGAGPQVKFKNGCEASFLYRNRVTDFEEKSMEHGFFLGATIRKICFNVNTDLVAAKGLHWV